jgi:hypothetical protein
LEKTVATDFEVKPEKTVTTDFEAKPEKTVATGFEVKSEKIVATSFEAKPEKTVTLGFEAQPRNPRFSSSCARCRPHTTPSDLSISRPSSTRPVGPSSVLYTRSPTLVMILIAVRHAAPATCTPRDKQTRFSKRNRDKGNTIKMSRIRIQISPSK